jgi:N-acetylglucosaminyl-diphospho-decaprenol L-rhamnosyltransferase
VTAEVSLITVTYNSARTLERFWAGRPFHPYAWTVVDNGSSDGSADVARRLGAQVVELGTNRGFSAANNVGVSVTESEVVLFCNPDVTVTADGIAALAARARRHGGIVAPQLVNVDGTLQENGRGIPYLHRKVGHLLGRDSPGYVKRAGASQVIDVAWVMGAALAMTRADFLRTGGWDPAYFLYYEDHDLGLRARAMGLPVRVDGGVRWLHGWRRETRRDITARAWRNELRSAARFYGTHPYCLVPLPDRRTRQLRRLGVA